MFFPTWEHLYDLFNPSSALMAHGLFYAENPAHIPEECRSDPLFQDPMFQDPIFQEMRRKRRST